MVNRVKTTRILAAVFIYAVGMALVEAAVVVYMRELYYPGGFVIRTAADLAVIPARILTMELWREAATIVMLAVVGYLSFGRFWNRFAAFIFAFSIWDLAYYVFLYLFLSWPPSLSTLDIYYLIPRAWIGPVWFPIILFTFLGAGSFWFVIRQHSH